MDLEIQDSNEGKIFLLILLSDQLKYRNVWKQRSYNISNDLACRFRDSSNILFSTALLALLDGNSSTSLGLQIGIGLIWFLLLNWASVEN